MYPVEYIVSYLFIYLLKKVTGNMYQIQLYALFSEAVCTMRMHHQHLMMMMMFFLNKKKKKRHLMMLLIKIRKKKISSLKLV